MTQDAIERARDVRLIIFDVDGVMTDGTLFLADGGQEYKGFNSLDGHGLKMLKSTGVELAIHHRAQFAGCRSPRAQPGHHPSAPGGT